MVNIWKPYCHENKCGHKHIKIPPTHFTSCRNCGKWYSHCICKFFEEPCLSCEYKRGLK